MERSSRCCGKHHKTHDYEKGNHSQLKEPDFFLHLIALLCIFHSGWDASPDTKMVIAGYWHL